MEQHIILLIAGVAMLILEMFTPSFVAGSVGIGFFFAAAASWAGLSNLWQLILGIIGMTASMIALRPFINKFTQRGEEKIKTNNNAMIGRTAKVIRTTEDGGVVKLDGTEWNVRTTDYQALKEGTIVEVTDIDSIILIVKSK